MKIDQSNYIAHYGILRRSGRYPWGSGDNLELETARSFLDYVDYLMKKVGLRESEAARDLGISVEELRAKKTIAIAEEKAAKIIMIERLAAKGYGPSAIGQRLDIPESTVRSLMAPGVKEKTEIVFATSNQLKNAVAEKGFVQVGEGVEVGMGISETKLKAAIAILREEGYVTHTIPVLQQGTGKNTNLKVLAPPGTTWGDVMKNRDQIQLINAYSEDGGRTFSLPNHPPIPVSEKRVGIVYGPDGGASKDGVIYVRPGVSDVSLGASSYAQVRVQVGDGHYLKGMAMYHTDLPDGVDLLFHTNKSDTGNKLDALKGLTDDPDLPFGAVVRQITENTGTPKEKNISAMNIVNAEGKWGTWSEALSSQMLSKQSPKLIREQLDVTFENQQREFDEIMKLTNPTVRKKLLESFADGTDAKAVHLKAAHMPRQGTHVLLPLDKISPTEIYAPNFNTGERVVLIRHPHGGTFEIPELQVNNNNPQGVKLLGQAKDAVGIHHSVAEILSGADFDGDTVLVIPNAKGKIKVSAPLAELKNFDPRTEYKGYPGMRPMTNKQTEMGKVSNLISDMTLRGAPHSDIAKAVKHSMVVIDAENHNLNYKQSEIDNGIKRLREKYQAGPDGTYGGASTLISRAKSPVYLPVRKPRPAKDGGPIDRETGERVYVETGAVNEKTGKPRTFREKRLAVTSDARTLSSGTRQENLYADHSNKLKKLANTARLEALKTPRLTYSPSAKKVYQAEVDTLNGKLATALSNAPRERQAQLTAGLIVKAKIQANPELKSDKDSLKKIKNQALNEARARNGASKEKITFTPREWEAIQAGAISDTKLKSILANADLDSVKEFATPKTQLLMTPTKTRRAQSMLDSGYTRADVARQLGVSLTTLDVSING